MYPRFPDLLLAHQERITELGGNSTVPDGGKIFRLLMNIFGWKFAKRMQLVFYNIGYQPNSSIQ
jgi:hypothetical protein